MPQWHEGRVEFDYGAVRDNDLADLGWTKRCVTWTMLRETPVDAACKVGIALGLTPATWRTA